MITTHLDGTVQLTQPTRSARAALVPRIGLPRSKADQLGHDDDFEGFRNWSVILTLSAIFVLMATCPVLVLA